MARRFAGRSSAPAIAPELFVCARAMLSLRRIAKLVVGGDRQTPDAQVMGDLARERRLGRARRAAMSLRAWASPASAGAAAPRRGCTSAHNPAARRRWLDARWRAATSQATSRRWTWPRSIKAPVLGLYGAADEGIPRDTLDKMMAALKAAGNGFKSELVVYPDTPHAFHADYRPSYRWRGRPSWSG